MWTWLILLCVVVAGFLLGSLVTIHVLRQHRSSQSTIAWIAIIMLLPPLGIPLYLSFGGRKSRKRLAERTDFHFEPSAQATDPRAQALERVLTSYNLPPATWGNKIKLCQDGVEAFEALLEIIDKAKESIHIQTFVFGTGNTGQILEKHLTERAKAGVKVRLMIDAFGSLGLHRRFFKSLEAAGGKVTFFNPVMHIPFLRRTNLRNHRKITVVDEKYVWAGGTNLAEEYIGPTPLESRWRDLAFTLQGPAVAVYSRIFCGDWHAATNEKLSMPDLKATSTAHKKDGALVQICPSGPDVLRDVLHGTLMTAFFQAERRLWVVTPYFVPDDPLVRSLILAAHRGVDVRVILPKVSNQKLADIARGTYLREMQNAGVRIHLFAAGMVHAKVVVIDDDLAIVGSANMDMRSLFLNYEVAMLQYSRPEVDATSQWVTRLMEQTDIGVEPVGNWRETFEGIVRIFAPLL